MNQLEEALREQIDYCVKMEYFHSAVFCFDQEKKTIVEELLNKIIEDLPEESHLLLSRRDNTSVLFFSNSSILRVFNLSDLKTNRGYKCQKLIYDETTQHSDFEEADVDFCAECIRYFMKKHISYKEAEMKYTKKNLNFNSDEKF